MSKKTVCVAGKNDIAVNVLAYLHAMEEKDFDLVVSCNRNEDGENGWQKSVRFFANKMGIKEVALEDVYEIPDLIFLSLEFKIFIHFTYPF